MTALHLLPPLVRFITEWREMRSSVRPARGEDAEITSYLVPDPRMGDAGQTSSTSSPVRALTSKPNALPPRGAGSCRKTETIDVLHAASARNIGSDKGPRGHAHPGAATTTV